MKVKHSHFWRTAEVDGKWVTKCESCPKELKLKARKKPRRKTARLKTEEDLDALAKKILIVSRGENCERCADIPVYSSHIFPKGTYKRMRWMTQNLLLLCYQCHMEFWHKHPMEAKRWFEEKFPGRYEQLLIWTRQMPAIDLKEIRISLEIELKQLKGI